MLAGLVMNAAAVGVGLHVDRHQQDRRAGADVRAGSLALVALVLLVATQRHPALRAPRR